MFTHSCIKCHTSYEDNDPDPYYCAPCTEVKKALAAEIDAKFANRPRKEVRSALQEYDAAPKVRGFMRIQL